MEDIPVVLEFRGGAELLFDKKKVHEVVLPKKDKQWCIQDLLYWIKENLLKGRPELFMENDSVRPGILILVNDSDWELLDTVNYEIQPNDRIVFVSTLHGG